LTERPAGSAEAGLGVVGLAAAEAEAAGEASSGVDTEDFSGVTAGEVFVTDGRREVTEDEEFVVVIEGRREDKEEVELAFVIEGQRDGSDDAAFNFASLSLTESPVVVDSDDSFGSGEEEGQSLTEDLRTGAVSAAVAVVVLNIDAFSFTESFD
jgi:hypothetical protein